MIHFIIISFPSQGAVSLFTKLISGIFKDIFHAFTMNVTQSGATNRDIALLLAD
jgi:hypothetical protein